MDRVAVVALGWFVLWIGLGIAVGELFGTPGTGAVSGFFFAVLATLAWPWVMPDSLDRWMDGHSA